MNIYNAADFHVIILVHLLRTHEELLYAVLRSNSLYPHFICCPHVPSRKLVVAVTCRQDHLKNIAISSGSNTTSTITPFARTHVFFSAHTLAIAVAVAAGWNGAIHLPTFYVFRCLEENKHADYGTHAADAPSCMFDHPNSTDQTRSYNAHGREDEGGVGQ